jgi:hypothetical protein
MAEMAKSVKAMTVTRRRWLLLASWIESVGGAG